MQCEYKLPLAKNPDRTEETAIRLFRQTGNSPGPFVADTFSIFSAVNLSRSRDQSDMRVAFRGSPRAAKQCNAVIIMPSRENEKCLIQI